MEKLYQKRENLRSQIREFWKEGKTWTEKELEVNRDLNEVHDEIVKAELLDDSKPNKRVAYSVCGWSDKHGYFRNKRLLTESIENARKELVVAKSESNWKIPTVIVKETYLRCESPAMVDFEGDVNNLSFSSNQELVDKHMWGNREYKWKDLVSPNKERFTY